MPTEEERFVESGEITPLLPARQDEHWEHPKGFIWIETALWANVFLAGFDGTITAATYALISSDFNSANNSSWLTTSYLITSTAFMPLYGRFSDVIGRRACFFVSTITFMLGCIGCALANSMLMLIVMRCLIGFGGGGLVTMATIINSDMIPFHRRGMYQAMQNVCNGFGAIMGASLGGILADSMGWRWCFLIQVPVSLFALVVGYFALDTSIKSMMVFGPNLTFRSILETIDLPGALVLVVGLIVQLLGLSLGGNEFSWDSPLVTSLLVASVLLIAVFLAIEATTPVIPIIPLRMLKGKLPISIQITNMFAGMTAFAYLFMLPLFFQVVLGDTPSTAGLRLMIPSLATPIGGLIAGFTMAKGGNLAPLVRVGAFFMLLGNSLIVSLRMHDSSWKYFAFVFPANLGVGISFPSLLFSFLAAFQHSEQAVATSCVYLIRSLGMIYGVIITSSLVHNVLAVKLPGALIGMPNSEKAINDLRHSVFALHNLPSPFQERARQVYYDAIRYGFIASASFAVSAFLVSFVANSKSLRRRGSSLSKV